MTTAYQGSTSIIACRSNDRSRTLKADCLRRVFSRMIAFLCVYSHDAPVFMFSDIDYTQSHFFSSNVPSSISTIIPLHKYVLKRTSARLGVNQCINDQCARVIFAMVTVINVYYRGQKVQRFCESARLGQSIKVPIKIT